MGERGVARERKKSIRKNIQKTLQKLGSQTKRTKNTFKTSLRPLAAVFGASSGYVWQELHFFLGHELQEDSLVLAVRSGKGDRLGYVEILIRELEGGKVEKLERQLVECSRPGAKISLASRLLFF